MEWIKLVYSWNIILSISLIGWLVAQVLKTLINFWVIGEFDLERMWGAGGMPSAHSSTGLFHADRYRPLRGCALAYVCHGLCAGGNRYV